MDRAEALRRAHAFFEEHSGWAPPDEATLADFAEEGLSPCPDECTAPVDGWCEHGIAGWAVVLHDPLDTGRAPPLDRAP